MSLENSKVLITDDTTVIIDLHQNELQLIRMLRTKYRFGDITIKMQDGIPMRIIRITEVDDLSKRT